jgi:hypothetical protein
VPVTEEQRGDAQQIAAKATELVLLGALSRTNAWAVGWSGTTMQLQCPMALTGLAQPHILSPPAPRR